MSILTVTEGESAERCGWQWEFNSKNKLGLESASPLRSLGLGSLWHKTLDALAQKSAIKEPHKFAVGENNLCSVCNYSVFAHMPDPFSAFSGFLLNSIIQHYQKLMGINPSSAELAEAHKTIALCRSMLDNYLDYYHGELLPAEYVYIQTEQQFYKTLPNTEHCTCYLQPRCTCGYTNVAGQRKSCRYKNGYYKFCRCNPTPRLVPWLATNQPSVNTCSCRENHTSEGTLDGLIMHTPTEVINILENKTFSVHPNIFEMKRTPQFGGYKWMGIDFGTQNLLYNGVWTRKEVPNSYNQDRHRKWNIHDLFVREWISWADVELEHWIEQRSALAMRIFDPNYVATRMVPPVGGCNGVNGCSYKSLCDARFASKNYEVVLRNEYRPRSDGSNEWTLPVLPE